MPGANAAISLGVEGQHTSRNPDGPWPKGGPGPIFWHLATARLTSICHAWKRFASFEKKISLFETVETPKTIRPAALTFDRPRRLCRARPMPIKARLHRIPTVPMRDCYYLRLCHLLCGRKFLLFRNCVLGVVTTTVATCTSLTPATTSESIKYTVSKVFFSVASCYAQGQLSNFRDDGISLSITSSSSSVPSRHSPSLPAFRHGMNVVFIIYNRCHGYRLNGIEL